MFKKYYVIEEWKYCTNGYISYALHTSHCSFIKIVYKLREFLGAVRKYIIKSHLRGGESLVKSHVLFPSTYSVKLWKNTQTQIKHFFHLELYFVRLKGGDLIKSHEITPSGKRVIIKITLRNLWTLPKF